MTLPPSYPYLNVSRSSRTGNVDLLHNDVLHRHLPTLSSSSHTTTVCVGSSPPPLVCPRRDRTVLPFVDRLTPLPTAEVSSPPTLHLPCPRSPDLVDSSLIELHPLQDDLGTETWAVPSSAGGFPSPSVVTATLPAPPSSLPV